MYSQYNYSLFSLILYQKLAKEAERLISEQPTREGLISDKQAEIVENWEALTERADNRKANLEQSRELQKFLADLRDLVRGQPIFKKNATPPRRSYCCYPRSREAKKNPPSPFCSLWPTR